MVVEAAHLVRLRKAGHPLGRGREGDAMASLTGPDPDPCRQMRLTRPGRAEEDDVLLARDEVEGSQVGLSGPDRRALAVAGPDERCRQSSGLGQRGCGRLVAGRPRPMEDFAAFSPGCRASGSSSAGPGAQRRKGSSSGRTDIWRPRSCRDGYSLHSVISTSRCRTGCGGPTGASTARCRLAPPTTSTPTGQGCCRCRRAGGGPRCGCPGIITSASTPATTPSIHARSAV